MGRFLRQNNKPTLGRGNPIFSTTESDDGGGGGSWIARATDPPAITHWWDPANGSDNNGGTGPNDAYLTFTFAVDETIAAGGVLGIVNGTYTTENTNQGGAGYMFQYEDINPGAGNRLWIRADDERQAIFETNGGGAFGVSGSQRVTFWGITANSPDGGSSAGASAVFESFGSEDMHFIRILIANINGPDEQYGFQMNISLRPYFEECETYGGTRHAISLQRCKGSICRRCYTNGRGNEVSGISAYRSNNTLTENCIFEGNSQFTNQCEFFDGELKGHSQLHLGGVMFGGGSIRPSYFRESGTHYNPDFGGNLWKHWLLVEPWREAIRHGSGTDYARYENITVWKAGAQQNNGPVIDHGPLSYDGTGETEYTNFVGEWPPVDRSLKINMLIFDTALGTARGVYREQDDTGWECIRQLTHFCLWNNGASDSWSGSTMDDNRDKTLSDDVLINNAYSDPDDVFFANSIEADPNEGVYGPDFANGQTLIYVPDGHSVLDGAGSGGGKIGAVILYRYEGTTDDQNRPTENLTSKRLWNPNNGRFPHGAVIEGYNDRTGDPGPGQQDACLHTLHTRLGISSETLPADY